MSEEDEQLRERVSEMIEWVTTQNAAKGSELVTLLHDLAQNVHKATVLEVYDSVDWDVLSK